MADELTLSLFFPEESFSITNYLTGESISFLASDLAISYCSNFLILSIKPDLYFS